MSIATGIAVLGEHSFMDGVKGWFGYEWDTLRKFNAALGVTWFLWVLLIFSSIYAATTNMAKLKEDHEPKPIPSFAKIMLFCFIMIPINFLFKYFMDQLGEDFLGFHLLKYLVLKINQKTYNNKAMSISQRLILIYLITKEAKEIGNTHLY